MTNMIRLLSRRETSISTIASSSRTLSLDHQNSYARLESESVCEECGAQKKKSRWGRHEICRNCIKLMRTQSTPQEFFFEHQTVYRALRIDEDPSKGLSPQNEHARFSLQEHVEYGASCHSQFISFCSSPEVAMYFAIKRALNRHEWPCRIVQVRIPLASDSPPQEGHRDNLSIPQKSTVHDVMASVDDSWSEQAQKMARLYEEICVESSIHSSFVDRTFEVQQGEAAFFKDHLQDVRDFKVQFYKSSLNARFEAGSVDESRMTITSRIVDLQHFRESIQQLPKRGIKKIGFQLIHQPDERDKNTIAVVSLDDLDITLGYVTPDHACILAKHIPNMIAYQKLNAKDMTGGKHELALTLHFRLPTILANKVAIEIHRSGRGNATLTSWIDDTC